LLLAPLITRNANIPAPGSTINVSLRMMPVALASAPNATIVYATSGRKIGVTSIRLVELPATLICTSRDPASIV
jgi:hypothetical protein